MTSVRRFALLAGGLVCIASIAVLRPAKASGGAPSREERIDAFIHHMIEEHGFERSELEAIFERVRFEPEIIRVMSRSVQPVPWNDYRPLFVNAERVSGGLRFWTLNRELLARARRDYGVPEELITAIIGVETQYGRNTGRYRVIDALSTLAFDYPPRADLFRSQLEEFLLLTREEGFGPTRPRGSFAGAMGIAQFMPASYRSYAVDFDRDGRRDLFGNVADAIGSVANYISEHGWQVNQAVAVRAEVRGDYYLSFLNAGLEPLHPIAQWKWLGVRPTESVEDRAKAFLFSLEGQDGSEYWLGLTNFYVITRYNRSAKYAMAVHELGREIRSRRLETSAAGAP